MRTEIKRSLLVWPLMASAAISAAGFMQNEVPAFKGNLSSTLNSWLTFEGHKMASIWDAPAHEGSLSLDAKPIALGTANSSIIDGSSSRGLAVIEQAISSTNELPAPRATLGVILAPVRNESYELAGCSTDAVSPTPTAPVSIDRLLSEIWSGGTLDVMNVGKSLAGQVRGSDDNVLITPAQSNPIGVGVLAQLGHRAMAAMRRTESASPNMNDSVAKESTGANPIVSDGLLELLPANSRLPQSTRVLAKAAAEADPVLEIDNLDDGATRVSDSPSAGRDWQKVASSKQKRDWPAGWPATPRLSEQLDELSQAATASPSANADGEIQAWIDSVNAELAELRSLNRLGATEAGQNIQSLGQLSQAGMAAAESLDDRDLQVQMLRAAHAINRRVAVWQPVWKNASHGDAAWMIGDQNRTEVEDRLWEVSDAIAIVKAELAETGDEAGWSDFLLLDELGSAATAKREGRAARSIVAQRLLSRLDWHALEGEHLRWLRRDSVMNLAAAIRPWTQAAVDYAELLRQIERQESDAIDLAAIDIASAVQSLRFADNQEASSVAKSLDTHYRNANVRMALSHSMLNRLLPSVDPKTVPVRTTVLGTRVRGISHINSDLNVHLTPSQDRWMLQFQTLGNIQTQSTGFNGPVAIRTTGDNEFTANAPIQVTRDGVELGDVQVDVRGRTKLRGIRSDYDGWPLVGALVRSFASSKYDSMKPKSNRIATNKIRSQVADEMETELDGKVSVATGKLSKMVLGPLGKLRLDPQVIDMQTTESRLLARYRLAGDWQVAAFTPRPRAPRSSLMSVQAHQSAINNTLEQLVPRDAPMPINEVITRAASMFGQSIVIPEDVPGDVTIQFARTRPITAEIEDGRLWVTLRVVKLSREEGMALTNFIVRAAYLPKADGLQASLVRDGHLRISGPGMSMRERLPVRAIFNKVLSADRPLPMTLPSLVDHPAMEGLAISQFELRGGWIGIAISESDAPRVAMQENSSQH